MEENVWSQGYITPPHIHNLSTCQFERTLGRAPQKKSFCHEDTADKNPTLKTDQEKCYGRLPSSTQNTGNRKKKDLCSNGKQQDIGQENWVLKRYQISYRNSSLINKN